ncbi:MAG TPA: UDP-N-acetylmuramoyl-tripeptide--D-alanyl-D-alanine ligase [Gammaproteobacteria bacterium]
MSATAKMTDLDFIALHTGARLVGEAVAITGVSTDTRRMRAGELFVALSGPRFDGHDFASAAAESGAAALLVDRQLDCELPQLLVDDTLIALGRFAAAWRGLFSLPVIGVTGSTGKTTVKQMLTAILAGRGDVLATEGNLNNDIGVPLTLLRLREEHRFAVVEMGANHAGEIAALAALVRPTVGLVTNAGAAHLEGFGSIEGVVEAKGEMYPGVVDGGSCIINGDQPWAEEWKLRAGARRKLTFGLDSANDFHVAGDVRETDAGIAFRIDTRDGAIDIELPLHGRHNVMNALAAAAAAFAVDTDFATIAAGLRNVANVGGRMHVERLGNGVVLVDDTYNANPLSMRAAIDWLAAGQRRGWLVMGDMGELGADARALHEEIGNYAAECGVERMYCLGGMSAAACAAFGSAHCYTDHARLIDDLAAELEAGVTVLVKGSRSARMERVTAGLRERGMR